MNRGAKSDNSRPIPNRLAAFLVRAGLPGLIFGVLALANAPGALALPQYFQQIPEGLEKSCNLCHSQPPVLNDFGRSFQDNNFSFAGLANPSAGGGSPPAGPTGGGSGTTDGQAPTQVKSVPRVELLPPAGVTRGAKTTLQARVTLDGRPLPDTEVKFSEEANFFVQGNMELGSSTTDDQGLAEISWWPRSTEERVKLTAGVAGDNQLAQAEGSATVTLAPSGPLVEHPEGLNVPFFGLWMILLVVAVVWVIFGYIVFSTLRIRKLVEAVEERKVSGVA